MRAAVFVAADREGLPRIERFLMIVSARSAGFSHDQRLPQRHLKALGRAVPAGSEVSRPAGLVNSAMSRLMARDQSERVET